MNMGVQIKTIGHQMKTKRIQNKNDTSSNWSNTRFHENFLLHLSFWKVFITLWKDLGGNF